MRSSLRAVVFDLDGTLCDSAPDIADALNLTFADEGMAPLDLATVTSMVGGGADLLIERALRAHGESPGAERIGDVLARFLEAYRAQPCSRTHLYPGARDTLDRLAHEGVRLGICTNKPEDLTGLVLDRLGIGGYFGSVVAARFDVPPKPAPGMLQAALSSLGLQPQHVVMVGDSAADAGVARAAGFRCVLLAHGYSTRPVAELGADLVLPGFEGLFEALLAM